MSNGSNPAIDAMFSVGAHFGLARSRRNPSIVNYIFGTKNRTDIFDLEKTHELVDKAKSYITSLASEGKIVLFVGGKKEASTLIKDGAQSIAMPYVDNRWIGGTLTNFTQMRKRIDRYEKLLSDREKGELSKYTKRERMLIDKEIDKLEKMFLGIVSMKKIPDALFIIDPRHEKSACAEATKLGIPIVAVLNSDCSIAGIRYPMIGNDAARSSIRFFIDEMVGAYRQGKKVQ